MRSTLIAITLASAGFAAAGFHQATVDPTPPPAAPAAAPATTAEAGQYAIDSVHSTALFSVQHLGAGRFWGRFNQLDGGFRYADGGTEGPQLDVTIPIASVDTNSEGLDKHLKSPDFFNAKEFESMSFRSRSASKTGAKTYTVMGDLTMHGVTKEIAVNAEWVGTANMGRGQRCGIEATFSIKRSDYGIMYGVEEGMVGDEVTVIVSLEGTLQE